MKNISSKALNGIGRNKEKTFQDQRFDDELGLDWVQFKYRNHDPQIGRFVEIDPLAEKYVGNSTYAFSENCVTNNIELEGLEKAPPPYNFANGYNDMPKAWQKKDPSTDGSKKAIAIAKSNSSKPETKSRGFLTKPTGLLDFGEGSEQANFGGKLIPLDINGLQMFGSTAVDKQGIEVSFLGGLVTAKDYFELTVEGEKGIFNFNSNHFNGVWEGNEGQVNLGPVSASLGGPQLGVSLGFDHWGNGGELSVGLLGVRLDMHSTGESGVTKGTEYTIPINPFLPLLPVPSKLPVFNLFGL